MPSANIRDLGSLKELMAAFKTFQEESNELLSQLNGHKNELLFQIKVKEKLFRNKVAICEEFLEEARLDLRECESTGYYDENDDWVVPNCTFQESRLESAKQRLEKAEYKLADCLRIFEPVYSAIGISKKYQSQLERLKEEEGEEAIRSLNSLINGAENYIQKKTSASNLNNEGPLTNNYSENSSPTFSHMNSMKISNGILYTSKSGEIFEFKEKLINDRIFITIHRNGESITGSNLRCGTYTISSIGGIKKLKIGDLNLPEKFKGLGLGTKMMHLIEQSAFLNSCEEIYGWADNDVKGFYDKLGYNFRNERNSGSELYKKVENNLGQKLAKSIFENFTSKIINKELVQGTPAMENEIDPWHILTPELNPQEKESFWTQHNSEGAPMYRELLKNFQTAYNKVKSGVDPQELWKLDKNLQNAYNVFFSQGEQVRLYEKDGFLKLNGNGRHRILMAQNLNIKISAEVIHLNPLMI